MHFSSALSISHNQKMPVLPPHPFKLPILFFSHPYGMGKCHPGYHHLTHHSLQSPLPSGCFPVHGVPSKAFSKCFKRSIMQHSQETLEFCNPIPPYQLQHLSTALLSAIKDFLAQINSLIVSSQRWIRARIKLKSQVSGVEVTRNLKFSKNFRTSLI